jgi:hypothetical protein
LKLGGEHAPHHVGCLTKISTGPGVVPGVLLALSQQPHGSRTRYSSSALLKKSET